MSRRSPKWSRAWTLTVELVGLALSIYLLLISLRLIHKDEVPCIRGKWFHCSSILRQEWSHIGPIPVAALGVAYFVGQLFLTAAAKKKGWHRWAKFAGVLGGLGYISWLRAIEFVWLKGICPWCWGVALCVVVEAILVYPMGTPPLPKLKLAPRIGWLSGILLFMIGIAVAGGSVWKDMEQERRRSERLEALKRAEATPTPEPPKPRATPALTIAAKTPAPTPQPRPPASPTPAHGIVEEGVLETDEVAILSKRGWNVVAVTESVQSYIRSKPPVLLLAFDPFCEECHALIHDGLDTNDIARLPVTLVAVEQTSLEGELSDQVKNVPTLLLIEASGKTLFKHEGRMETKVLTAEIEKSLQ